MKKTIVLAMLLLGAAIGLHAEQTRLIGINGAVYSLTPEEADAVEFLYSAMPMSDRLMMTPDYFISTVRTSLLARKELPWGEKVPDDVWKYFVLPPRSGNENIDNFRTTYYPQLRDRVKGMDMRQAALEVNHWLHEHVTYWPSDSRTSAPMATLRTAKGRCGEESVLGVAAFRAVGIPARQVYTPRWAHTDDNHAWVEVWIDGKWHFLGACEPEPDLDRAWFNAPVSRGMLMHTRVFGHYPGPEQIISVRDGITEINVTDGYVPVRQSLVKVTDRNGRPLAGVSVEYKIYNYAEFFTGAVMTTDANGEAMLRTGRGDMLAWAAKDGYFGFSVVNGDTTLLCLDHKVGEVFSADLEIVPPAENPLPSTVTQEQIDDNARRFAEEDRLRALYESTFYGGERCDKTPQQVRLLFPDQARFDRAEEFLRRARGGWRSILDFLVAVPEARLDEALDMLDAISPKDLRDTPSDVLLAGFLATEPQSANPLYIQYVLSPRISNELLTDWHRTLRPALKSAKGMDTPAGIIDFVRNNIKVNDAANSYRVPVTPEAVWKGREADSRSRDIFFVALCRTAGIPARLDPMNSQVQYWDGANWTDVDFGRAKVQVPPRGKLKATYEPTQYLADPAYYRHFTISSLNTGSPRLLDFGDELGETYTSLLASGLDLPMGYYVMTTGVRQASGAVVAHMDFFNIAEGETLDMPLTVRHSPGAIEVIGAIDAEKTYRPLGEEEVRSILSTTGRGYFLLGLLGNGDEPTNHAVLELASLQKLLADWGRPILLIGPQRDELSPLNPSWGSDPDGKVREMMATATGREYDASSQRLPIIMVADSFGRVVFYTEGYDTSLAQKLSSLIPAL